MVNNYKLQFSRLLDSYCLNSIEINNGDIILDCGANVGELNLAGDKAISIGEKSKVNANKLKIIDTFIGVASKDFSRVFIKSLNVKNSKICLASYQKKPEYGPGFINIEELTKGCDSNYILEDGSSILSNGYNLIPNTDNAYSELYE